MVCLAFSTVFWGNRLIPLQRNEMIVATFLSSAVVSLAYLFAVQGRQTPAAFRMGKAAWGYAVGSSLSAALAVYLLMMLLTQVPSYILYTVINGSLLVLSALLTAVVLRERMTKVTVAGILLSVLSIVLLSL